MQKKSLLIVALTAILLTSAIIPAFAGQPPITTSTYWMGTIGQPRRLDPARAYDTASGEIIQNVYDTLITYVNKPLATPAPYGNDVPLADLSQYKASLAYPNYTISGDGLTWTFWINTTDKKWHPWKDRGGVLHDNDFLTAEDVEYTFERMLVQDCYGAPSWMLCLPLLNLMFLDALDPNATTSVFDGASEAYVGNLINNAITRDGDMIQFHMNFSFPEVAFKQILAQTWGGIVHKAFCIDHGCWPGTFAAGWSHWRRYPSSLYTPLDRWVTESGRTEAAADVPTMCGTGPYTGPCPPIAGPYWNKATLTWRIDKFAAYWGGWAGTHLNTIITRGIPEWPTRKMMFLAGDIDHIAVPRANMWDLLDPSDPTGHTPLAGINVYYGYPALSLDAAAFVMKIDATSPYASVTTFPDGAPLDFFNNSNVRRAFCYSLNFTTYLRDAWWGEGIAPTSWWVKGLAPDYQNYSLVGHNLDYTMMENEFKVAMFGGTSVWDSGFTTTLVYNLGNDQRKIACEMMRDAIQSLNAKRAGKPPFKVNVVGLDWPVFLDYEELFYMPMFFVGWLADFADADNFARPYMHSFGDFAYFQRYNNTRADYLIDLGIKQADGPARNATYQELQYIYWYDNPGLPLVQATGRRWIRDWVKGWYYNQLHPGNLYYDLYKVAPGVISDVNVGVATIEVGSTNITDHLITQAYHAPRAGVPWMKCCAGHTCPIVQVNSTVQRFDAGPPAFIYIMAVCFGETALGHVHEFGSKVWQLGIAGSGFDVAKLGPFNASDILRGNPAPGNYTLWVKVFVLSGNAQNVQVSPDFKDGWFIVLGYGDVGTAANVADYKVKIDDIVITIGAFGSLPGSVIPPWRWSCDVNCDGKVTIADIVIVIGMFGTAYTPA